MDRGWRSPSDGCGGPSRRSSRHASSLLEQVTDYFYTDDVGIESYTSATTVYRSSLDKRHRVVRLVTSQNETLSNG